MTLDRERCEQVKVRLPAVSDPAPLAVETVTVIDPPEEALGTRSEIRVGSPAPRSRAATPDAGGRPAADAGRSAAEVVARERAELLVATEAVSVSVGVPAVVVGALVVAVGTGLAIPEVDGVGSETVVPRAVGADPATGGDGA